MPSRAVRTLVAALCAATAALAGCSTDESPAPSPSADYADIATSPACTKLRQDHPSLADKTMRNAINPYTPGYETVDPNDPGKYQGFDVDLGNAIGACLGFTVGYVPVGFSELVPTVAGGRADWILSNLYATKERAQGGVDFVSYSKVFDGILVTTGNPKKITGIDPSMCGQTIALNKGYVEVPLIQALGGTCQAQGKPSPTISLFDNSSDCVQAILAGRADAYMNDVNTVKRYIAAHPGELASADTVKLDYTIGIGVPKDNHDLRDAVVGAVTEIQSAGLQAKLATKWKLDENAVAQPTVLSAD
jgi:polar amino acid transport system substrate-binding protein